MISEFTLLMFLAGGFFLIVSILILSIKGILLKAKVFILFILAVSSISLYLYAGSPKLYNSSALFSQQEAFANAIANLETDELNSVVESFEKILQSKLAEKSKYVDIWRQLVGLKISQGKYTQAYKLALRILELFPKDIELRYLLVRAKINLNNGIIDDESNKYLLEILDFDLNNTKARWLLAIYALQQNNILKAKNEFQSILLNVSDPVQRQNLLEQMQELIGKSDIKN